MSICKFRLRFHGLRMAALMAMCCPLISRGEPDNTGPAKTPGTTGGSAPTTAVGRLPKLLGDEIDYSMKNLVMPDGTKPYYLAYIVNDTRTVAINARLGALMNDVDSRNRQLDVDLRVGDYSLDNTHQIRGGGFEPDLADLLGAADSAISLTDDADAIRQALWLATDREFKSAAKRFGQVKTNIKTRVDEEDKSHDFSREKPSVYGEPEMTLNLDRKAWAERLRAVSKLCLKYPLIYNSNVSLAATVENRTMASSEGTRLQTGRKLLRVVVSAATKAEDGMDLSQSFIFSVSSEDRLPTDEQITDALQKVIDQTLALRDAPLVEPYTGPAILLNRAAGVFFHEIFGHRIEGHRQKNAEEGQTFTKMIGQSVLPEFLSVHDDPSRLTYGSEDLRGHYKYDDEGVAAQDVRLVENGILKTFLLSRSPVSGFSSSNGHGRHEAGRPIVSRQGNLIVDTSKPVPFAKLREMLIEECKKQDKPYGLLFEDITGGFTMTGRGGPQAFKVLPVVVYRIFADGRKDELVRGVDIVGTPLSCFSKITAAGDDQAVFNGTCGAESGWVPVSAVAPSVLVSQIEIEKRQKSQDKLPILPPPIAEHGKEPTENATPSKTGA